MSDIKPISFKTYFGSRLPQLLHVFSLMQCLSFINILKLANVT